MLHKQKLQQKHKKKTLWIVIIVVLLAIAALGVLELTHKINLFHHKPKSPHTSNQYTKGEGTTPSSQGNKGNGQSSGGDTYTNTKGQSDTPPTPEATLSKPTGNFVSAHQFSLASNPPIGSSCETTPKATCQITFTNGSKTVQLDKKTTDDGGAAYWTWKPNDIGLTTGTWKIEAKAQLGSKTLTAEDALNLQITP